MYSVYALVDPRDESVRYVGMSKNVWRRYAMHLLTSSKSTPTKDAWVAELRKIDLSPLLKIIETMERVEEAGKRETYWILRYLSEGEPLLNIAKIGSQYQPRVEGDSDVAVIARGLRVSEGSILNLIRTKTLPARKVNGEWCVEQEDLDHWLAQNMYKR